MATREEAIAELERRKAGSVISKDEAVAELQRRQQAPAARSVQPQARQTTAGDVGNELISAINRGVIDVAEFLSTTQVNSLLNLVGSDKRITPLSQVGPIKSATEGGFMAPGLARDVVQTAGEFTGPGAIAGSGIRNLAQQVPKAGPELASFTERVLSQLGAGTASGDVVLSAISGAGAAAGQEAGGPGGAIVGSILAPLSAVGVKSLARGVFDLGADGFNAVAGSVKGMSDDGASTLLAEAMTREGLSPDDVLKRMADLGPEALPADVGTNFARLLRTASNEIPRIEGLAGEVLHARQSTQGARVLNALDDATGTSTLTLDDEIVRLDNLLKPQIRALYDEAGEQAFKIDINDPLRNFPTSDLKTLLQGESTLGKASAKVKQSLIDKQAIGETPNSIDLIDGTKKVMDDMIGKAIRDGATNRVRRLVLLKNKMVDEADATIPVYKEARQLFAGKVALESAAEQGQLFLTPKMKPRDIELLVKSMGESERKMFKLGAKEAILDKVNTLNINADTVSRIFGKNGDVQKLKSLFSDEKSFNTFKKVLERETQFIITRNQARANSTTAKQIADTRNIGEAFNNATQALSSPVGTASVFARVIQGLSQKKGSEAYIKALEQTGDILLTKGVNPNRVRALLRKGNAQRIESALRQTIQGNLKGRPGASAISGGVIGESEQRRKRPGRTQ